MSKTATKSAGIRGITKMTVQKHNYDGLNVRRYKHGYSFRCYVGASRRAQKGVPDKVRFDEAMNKAIGLLEALDRVIYEPKNWRTADGGKRLTKKAGLELSKLGFKVEISVG